MLSEGDKTLLKILGFIGATVLAMVVTTALIYFSLIYFAYIVAAVNVIATIDFGCSVYSAFRGCDSMSSFQAIFSYLVWEAIVSIAKLGEKLNAILFGVGKITEPNPC